MRVETDRRLSRRLGANAWEDAELFEASRQGRSCQVMKLVRTQAQRLSFHFRFDVSTAAGQAW